MKANRLLVLTILAAVPMIANGSSRSIREWRQPVTLAAASFSNSSERPEEILLGDISAPAASRVRIALGECVLGPNSKVRFTSLQDGQSQTLDAEQLAMWSNTSALFNGETVRVEVILAPGDRNVSVHVQEVVAFSDDIAGVSSGPLSDNTIAPETLCGSDDRVASTDNRSGRLNGNCTGWLVANGAVLTAGHCLTAAGNILEVNVPASQANGTQVAAAVQNQFPVLAGSITSSNAGVGNDWSVFRIGPNNLGQSAHQLHGFFRMTRELPAAGATTRVTGCGLDNTPVGSQPTVCGNRDAMGNCTHFGLNAQNQTQQTATGAFVSETGTTSPISLNYSVDTEPANSGSPIIWEANGFTIGIHTNGGCTASGGSNSGTSFELNALENAIDAVPGPNCRYLDRIKAPGGAEDGGIFQPFDTLSEAISSVPAGGRVSIVTGNYSAAGTTISKAMTISAPVGAATLGN